MINRNRLIGHIFAIIAITVWGITFVNTKFLLKDYSPISIMTMRFTLAYVALWIIHPKPYKSKSLKEELNFAMGGLTGVFGYFIMENTSLVYTTASNTGLILSVAPLFVAIVAHIFGKDEKFHRWLLAGFLVAMVGIALVIFNGQVHLKVNPLGDFLAIVAALMWAFYSLAIKRMEPGISPIIKTRQVFFYGSLAGIISVGLLEKGIDVRPLYTSSAGFHVLFLGLVASGLCYILWNDAISRIGAIKTSNYIYVMPVITMIASVISLGEEVNAIMILGCFIIFLGVYVAERGEKLIVFLGKNK